MEYLRFIKKSILRGDQGLLTQGFADPNKYTNRAAGVTFGIDWYPVDMIRVMLNYYQMDFGDSIAVGDTTIDNEDVIMTRVELAPNRSSFLHPALSLR
ncbi:MAG: hypothetical protein MUO68_15380 [Desulfobacteraceae bacterium]|nr:hypothetical protein [Desulfobacteraceae bacterium]